VQDEISSADVFAADADSLRKRRVHPNPTGRAFLGHAGSGDGSNADTPCIAYGHALGGCHQRAISHAYPSG